MSAKFQAYLEPGELLLAESKLDSYSYKIVSFAKRSTPLPGQPPFVIPLPDPEWILLTNKSILLADEGDDTPRERIIFDLEMARERVAGFKEVTETWAEPATLLTNVTTGVFTSNLRLQAFNYRSTKDRVVFDLSVMYKTKDPHFDPIGYIEQYDIRAKDAELERVLIETASSKAQVMKNYIDSQDITDDTFGMTEEQRMEWINKG